MFLVLVAVLLIVSIDYALGNKFSDAISDHIEHICSKLYNKCTENTNLTLDEEKKETTKFFMRPKFFGEKEYLPMQGLQVNTPFFNVPISFNTLVNILDIVGLDNKRWIVDWKSGFELIIQGQYIDLTSFCDIDHIKTIVFSRGEIQFTLNVNCETGETFIKTNSKAFETEIATIVFKAVSI